MTNIADASKIYANALKGVTSATGAEEAKAVTGPSFGDVLQAKLQDTIDAQHKSEKTSAAAVVGKADMTDVIQAINEAEMALDQVLAIRDRVISAYQQLMRTSM